MPVIVVGADTSHGNAVVRALMHRSGEVRVFVTAQARADEFRTAGVKVALGDVSDASHVGGAALNAFSAVLIGEAAADGRERAFAGDPVEVASAWAQAVAEAGVTRVIWVSDDPVPRPIAAAAREVANVVVAGRTPEEIAAEVAALDDAERVAD
jgi:putative NADH-flavin reductase